MRIQIRMHSCVKEMSYYGSKGTIVMYTTHVLNTVHIIAPCVRRMEGALCNIYSMVGRSIADIYDRGKYVCQGRI